MSSSNLKRRLHFSVLQRVLSEILARVRQPLLGRLVRVISVACPSIVVATTNTLAATSKHYAFVGPQDISLVLVCKSARMSGISLDMT